VWAQVQGDAELATLRRAIRDHVTHYGDRALSELKLEAKTLVDDPSPIVAMIRNYLRNGQSVDAMEAHEREIRAGAEKTVRRGLALHPLRRAAFSFVLSRCRRGMRTREQLRLTRGRMAGVFRKLFRALGDRFAEQGLLANADDIFYLTAGEIADAVRGASVTGDLNALVALRRSEYSGRDATAPVRTTARGIVHTHSLELTPPSPANSDGRLEGIGCSPGRVRRPALVVHSPEPDMKVNGEILVASTTDPGWVFLMIAAGGLVCERGSVLSHTAIIGRELGIPTVVGVADATRLIPDGAELEIDGRAGTVEVLSE
jgi:phosphohistidine swiveling domain-containing protein